LNYKCDMSDQRQLELSNDEEVAAVALKGTCNGTSFQHPGKRN